MAVNGILALLQDVGRNVAHKVHAEEVETQRRREELAAV
jgi:hypothetical protein